MSKQPIEKHVVYGGVQMHIREQYNSSKNELNPLGDASSDLGEP